jgi:hypothetical protein
MVEVTPMVEATTTAAVAALAAAAIGAAFPNRNTPNPPECRRNQRRFLNLFPSPSRLCPSRRKLPLPH